MQTHILECPRCNQPFEYESEAEDTFPASIQCPHCHAASSSAEYSTVIFCPQCHERLSMTLDLIGSTGLACPKCGCVFDDFDISNDEVTRPTVNPNEHLLKDGDYFDKYIIERFIGAGGMAEVYLARHMIIDRQCALKIMKPGLYAGNPDYVKRFVREARISFKLESPYIVKVYDSGRDARTGLLFIAMEYVEGKNLSQLAKKRRFSEDELRNIGLFMAQALKELQKQGIVHRDIKPANIIQASDGRLRLMDMGIAKNTSSGAGGVEATMTMENALMGTPAYASPEQCRSAHDADIRSDIYSLGATLYHLATGKAPYTGTTVMEIAMNVISGNLEPLKKVRKDLSSDFSAIVEQMMAKDPDKRPQSPQALEAMLRPSGCNMGKLLRRVAVIGVIMAVIGIVGYTIPNFINNDGKFDVNAATGGDDFAHTDIVVDISQIISGLPLAQKPSKPFRIEDYMDYLESTKAQNKLDCPGLPVWKNRADSEMVFSVLAGDVWNVYSLLELGFDINGLYEEAQLSDGTKPREFTLGDILFHGDEMTNVRNHPTYSSGKTPRNRLVLNPGTVNLWKDPFIRMFLFLVENGLELNKKSSSGKTVMDNLLALCAQCDDRDIWQLVPLALAYGGKIDQAAQEANQNIQLASFLTAVLKTPQTPPTPTADERLSPKEREKFTRECVQKSSYLKNPIRVVNVKLPNPLVGGKTTTINNAAFNQSTAVAYNLLRRLFACGIHPNALLLLPQWPQGFTCFSTRTAWCLRMSNTLIYPSHYAVHDVFYLRQPSPKKIEPQVWDFLLASGWRSGMERYFDELAQDAETLRLLWKHGVDVTVSKINACKDEEIYNLLVSLYKKQRHHHGGPGIIRRNKTYWDYFRAEKAIFTNDIFTLRQLLETSLDVDTVMHESIHHSLLEVALMHGTSSCVKCLLDNGKKVSDSDRVRGYGGWNLVEYSVGTLDSIPDRFEKLKLLWETGNLHKYDDNNKCTFLCEVLRNATLRPRDNVDASILPCWDYLMDKAGLKLHNQCPMLKSPNGGLADGSVMGAVLANTGFRYDLECMQQLVSWLLEHGAKPTPSALNTALARMRKSDKPCDKAGVAFWLAAQQAGKLQ